MKKRTPLIILIKMAEHYTIDKDYLCKQGLLTATIVNNAFLSHIYKIFYKYTHGNFRRT